MEKKSRQVARAIISSNGKILIAQLVGAHSFLPGGGVEMGEGVQMALLREIKEELGVTNCEVRRFIGVVENCFVNDESIMIHEVNYLFEVSSNELISNFQPNSFEPHLIFNWIDATVESFKKHNVLPLLLSEIIPDFFLVKNSIWLTNMR
ncbi:NUDIX domain-containing protein [Paenibacillus elgii]|uniref:NUDIX domain-containing protein n=1 Tax=Paenibacillus elgii TaxID=189691 RepID=UPI0016786AE6|nr:NUDIX domain-containing protein [Paenibacillus elgii]